MIKIDKHNVEAYYLDHLEGNLSEEYTSALFLFIEKNPEIAELFDDSDSLLDFKLEPESISFGDTNKLKVTTHDDNEISLSNIDTWLIAKAEKTLSSEEEQAVNEFVKINELELNEAYINATYLKPDLSKVYGDTHDLKTLQLDGEISLSNIDDWLIAKSEKAISFEEEQAVDEFVKLNKLESDEAYFNAIKLTPNLAETFGDISVLKKEEDRKIIPLLLRVVSIAAVFIFLWLIINPNQTAEQTYASRSNNNVKTVEPLYESQKTINGLAFPTNNNLANNSQTKQKAKSNPSVYTNKTLELASNKKPINLFERKFVSLKPKKASSYPPKLIPEDINISYLFSDFEETIALSKATVPNTNNDYASNDLVATNNGTTTQQQVQLTEQYRPITKRLSNFTQLDMSYKKSPEDADIAQTVIQIGKFSFERKRKK